MNSPALFILVLGLASGCGNDRRGVSSDGQDTGGAAGAPTTNDDLCDADCAAQAALSCVDASTCLERCQSVFESVSLQGCGAEYTEMLTCVADEDPAAYVCLDERTFGFEESSPCFAYSQELSACLRR